MLGLMTRVGIILTGGLVILAIGLTIAYYGIFGDSAWRIDDCSVQTRHYYLAPVIFRDRFAYGDYRDPQYDPSIPLVDCLCQKNDEVGYEDLVNESTTEAAFSEVCQSPPSAPYYWLYQPL